MKKYERIRAVIDLGAIRENFRNIAKILSKETKIIAVVKADAYGHGAAAVAKSLEAEPRLWGFGVSNAHEAEDLIDAGTKKPVLVFGHTFEEDYGTVVAKNIRPTVFDAATARELSDAAAAAGRVLPVHIAVDTGMTRIGFRCEKKSADEIKKIGELKNIAIEGIFTHFARADEGDEEPTKRQLEKFRRFLRDMRDAGTEIPTRHCANSAAALWDRESDMDAVRPGIALYGVRPSPETNMNGVALRPVLSLKSAVSFVKDVEKGVEVSYGGTYVTTRGNTKIATVPVGYADGYPRSLSNKGFVLIRGKRAKIVGRICMDQLMADVTDVPGVARGDEVTLIGRDGEEYISVEDLAETSGRFAYEFLCCLGKRVPRVYLNAE